MTLTELRYLIVLSQENHFGRAAARCHISQPSMSVAINKLESELGIAIFERDKNNVRITDIGKEVILQAQKVIDEAVKIKDIAEGGKSQLESPLRVGAIYTIGPYLFPNLIPQLQKIAPKMPLLIHDDYTSNLRRKLAQGLLDVVFVALPFEEKGVVTKELYQEPFVVLMRKDHPLAEKATVDADDLKPEELLLLGEGHCFRSQVIQACPNCYSEQNPMQRAVEGTSLETIRHMVASGLGLTVLPSTATQIEYYQATLCTKPFANNQAVRKIALAWRVSFTRPKAITALIQALQNSVLHGACLLP